MYIMKYLLGMRDLGFVGSKIWLFLIWTLIWICCERYGFYGLF